VTILATTVATIFFILPSATPQLLWQAMAINQKKHLQQFGKLLEINFFSLYIILRVDKQQDLKNENLVQSHLLWCRRRTGTGT